MDVVLDNRLANIFSGLVMEPISPAVDVVEDHDGYRFSIELPGLKSDSLEVKVEDETLVINGERKEPAWAKGTQVHRAERRYVLLAEHDAERRHALAAALRRIGHEVEEVSNGAELVMRTGRRMARIDAADDRIAIVVSSGLPVFSGAEAMEIVRRFGWQIPCVLIEGSRVSVLEQPSVNGTRHGSVDVERLRGVVQAECERAAPRNGGLDSAA